MTTNNLSLLRSLDQELLYFKVLAQQTSQKLFVNVINFSKLSNFRSLFYLTNTSFLHQNNKKHTRVMIEVVDSREKSHAFSMLAQWQSSRSTVSITSFIRVSLVAVDEPQRTSVHPLIISALIALSRCTITP